MKFTPITLSDFQPLKPYFDQQPHELCSYLLPSILAWRNDSFEAFQTVSGDDLILYARVKDRPCLFLPLVPVDRIPPDRLQDLSLDTGIPTFFPVPGEYLKYHGMNQVADLFHVEEMPKHSDYVYRTENLAQLKGNIYSKKRNLINQFERKYLNEGRVSVAPITSEDTDACLEFLEEWCLSNDCDGKDKDELACEKEAARYTLKHLEALGSKGLLLRVDGEISAFGIGARLTLDMGVLNFEKAFADIKGLYQYFDRECARQLFAGFSYINKENDMGEPGLRKAKKSYHPVRIVKAYQLTLR
jgi:hypothetical protein